MKPNSLDTVMLLLLLQMISKGAKKFLLSKVAPLACLPACLPQILFNFDCSLFGA
jgi:hypothetical protein